MPSLVKLNSNLIRIGCVKVIQLSGLWIVAVERNALGYWGSENNACDAFCMIAMVSHFPWEDHTNLIKTCGIKVVVMRWYSVGSSDAMKQIYHKELNQAEPQAPSQKQQSPRAQRAPFCNLQTSFISTNIRFR